MLLPRVSWLLLAAFAVMIATCPGRAENWSQFRGPVGTGHSSEKNLPLTRGGDNKENILWEADLPGEGIASPIVWKDRLFVLVLSVHGV